MTAPKLTKKQKKGLAFRERKGKGKAKEAFDEDLAVPEADPPIEEDLDVQAEQRGDEATLGQEEAAEEEMVVDEEAPAKHAKQSKKRKREEDVAVTEGTTEMSAKEGKAEGDAAPKKKKKQKVTKGNETEEEKEDGKKAEKSRFILFVGNLKYTTTLEAIQEHFSKCDPPPQVRLLTPKPKVPGGVITKSKGCAFLEFAHRNALQQGLKLHGSTLDGRRINVELTAGGGGKSEQRLKKVKDRNKHLLEERQTRVKKKMEAGDTTEVDMIAPPQRHSTTSGVESAPSNKRTWSVPEEGEESGRGGKKQRGKKKGPSKSWGSGANAIPVG